MSQRESLSAGSLQQWRGVNQRLQPTLVPDGFFSDARGIYFGYGENAERLRGKDLAGRVDEAVLNIFTFNNVVLVQTLTKLRIISIADLLAKNF